MIRSAAEVAMGIERLRASKYWSEGEGRRAVELWRASGESVTAFAARTGLRATRLSYWASRITPSMTVALARVTVASPRRSGVITIELRSGRAVRVEGDFDDALLARVIAAAERAAC